MKNINSNPFRGAETVSFFFGVVLTLMLSCSFLLSQAQDNPPTYFGFTYIKANNPEGYVQMAKKYRRQINENRVKEGKIMGNYLYQVIMPFGSKSEYNYISILVTNDFKTLFEDVSSQHDVYKKNIPGLSDATIDNIISQFNGVRTIVKREIFTSVGWAVPPSGGSPAKYAEVVYQQPGPGKQATYEKWEIDNWGPIHRATIELGTMKNWGVFRMLLPQTQNEYSNLTVNFFDDLSNWEEDFKYQDALNKAWPTMDFTKILALPGSDKKVIKEEFLRLVDYVQAPNPKK
jgi:hypothetical protein